MSDNALGGGNEFAVALFSLASEESVGSDDLAKEIMSQLSEVLAVFDREPEYYDLLACPGLSIEERTRSLDEVFGDSVHEYLLSFLKILCERKRIRELPECAEEYAKLLRARESVSVAKIVSAVELTEQEKTALIEKLEKISKKTVIPEYETDPTLLGGITVEMDGRLMDGSLRQRLREVKEVMNR